MISYVSLFCNWIEFIHQIKWLGCEVWIMQFQIPHYERFGKSYWYSCKCFDTPHMLLTEWTKLSLPFVSSCHAPFTWPPPHPPIPMSPTHTYANITNHLWLIPPQSTHLLSHPNIKSQNPFLLTKWKERRQKKDKKKREKAPSISHLWLPKTHHCHHYNITFSPHSSVTQNLTTSSPLYPDQSHQPLKRKINQN